MLNSLSEENLDNIFQTVRSTLATVRNLDPAAKKRIGNSLVNRLNIMNLTDDMLTEVDAAKAYENSKKKG